MTQLNKYVAQRKKRQESNREKQARVPCSHAREPAGVAPGEGSLGGSRVVQLDPRGASGNALCGGRVAALACLICEGHRSPTTTNAHAGTRTHTHHTHARTPHARTPPLQPLEARRMGPMEGWGSASPAGANPTLEQTLLRVGRGLRVARRGER